MAQTQQLVELEVAVFHIGIVDKGMGGAHLRSGTQVVVGGVRHGKTEAEFRVYFSMISSTPRGLCTRPVDNIRCPTRRGRRASL
jgi:hypothetical protein